MTFCPLKRMTLMTETKHYICRSAARSAARSQHEHEGRLIKEVSGNECNRGAKYARQEFTDPRRSLSTTVAIAGALNPRLPVKVSAPIHKDRVMEAVRRIHELQIKAPVAMAQVLIENLLGEKGVHVVACRTMRYDHRRTNNHTTRRPAGRIAAGDEFVRAPDGRAGAASGTGASNET